jgi:parallel beta-helix repeat protein
VIADSTSVVGNRIGTDAAGGAAIPNAGSGVILDSAGNTVSGNQISGNGVEGLELDGDAATGNHVTGNLVGTDAAGTAALPNGGNGIFVDASDNQVGGTTAADRNVVSGNGGTGIVISKVTSSTPPAGNTIEGNYVGVSASGAPLGNALNGIFVFQAGANDIGGTDPGSGNVISANARGLYLSLSGPGNVVYGNMIGTNPAGTSAAGFGNTGPGIRVEGSNGTTIGGPTATTRNVISGNGAEGIDLEVATTTDIEGNRIGTDVTGAVDLGNATDGVLVSDSPTNTIGGTTAAQANVISGNDQNGVRVTGKTTKANKVLANLIGTQADGTSPLPNTGDGVLIDGKAKKTAVGGAGARRNVISGNGAAGVFVDSGTGNAIRQNSISANGGLGIDLHAAGVNPNDAGDADTGANLGQNYPVVSSAVAGGGTTTVAGTLDSTASATFTVDVFWSPTRDPSLFGEGLTYLGSVTATTGLGGHATFSSAFAGAIPAGSWVTMTATDSKGNTSEFSQAKKST